MAIDLDVEATLEKMANIPEEKSDPSEAVLVDPYMDAMFPRLQWSSGDPEAHEFKGTVQYQPNSDNWRWVLYKRRLHGWRDRKVDWDHQEYGLASDEKAAEHDLRAAGKRHKRRSERTVLL